MQLQVNTSYKQILAISLPLTVSFVVPQLNFTINNIFLGHTNLEFFAVAGLTGVYYLVLAVLGNGLNNTIQYMIARRAGENNKDAIGNIYHQGMCYALLLAVCGIIFTWTIAPYILEQSLDNPKNSALAIQFLKIRVWGLPFLYVYQMRMALMIGVNQTRFLIVATLIETVVNIVLDYALIFGNFGFPNLGLNGAAIASVCAEFAGVSMLYFVIKKTKIDFQLNIFQKRKWDKPLFLTIVQKSAPLILQYALGVLAWVFFYTMIEHYGTQDLAISNIMRNIFGIIGCMIWSYASTTNAMVSNLIGQKDLNAIAGLIRKILFLAVLTILPVLFLLNIFPDYFFSFFGQDNSFIEAAIPVLRVVSVATFMMAFGAIYLNAVVGTGNTQINLLIELGSAGLYCLYVYILLGKLSVSIVIGWTSEFVYWMAALIPSFLYIHYGNWKKKFL